MTKEHFAKTLGMVRAGLARFAPFHVCAATVAVLHWLAAMDFVNGSLAWKFAAGVYWGAFAGVFVQLVGERRGKPFRWQTTSLATAAVAVVGCWLWLRIGEDSPHHCFLGLLYGGSLVSLAALSVAELYRMADERSLVPRLVLNAFCVCGSAGIFVASEALCLLAFDKLVVGVAGKVYGAAYGFSWLLMAPIGFVALLPGKDNDEGAAHRAGAFLFWLLLPASLAMLLILYVYLGKIVVKWEMPSGELNWFGSVALAAYVFFWLSLRDSPRKFFRTVVRWGWAFLLPVLAAQITGIVIRHEAYGLTSARFAGMATLSVGIVALALAALNRPSRHLFIYVAIAGLVFTVTPLNIVDVPFRNQEARLRSVLERNGLLKDGKFAPDPKVKLPQSDAKAIIGSWKYLFADASASGQNPFRTTAWYSPVFAESVHKTFGGGDKSEHALFAALGIDENAADNDNHGWRRHSKLKLVYAEVPVGGYSRLSVPAQNSVCCHRIKRGADEGGLAKWTLKLPRSGSWDSGPFDVTKHVLQLLKDAGSDGTFPEEKEGGAKKTVTNPERALWELRPGLAVAVERASASGAVGDPIRKIILDCAILTKPTNDGKGK